MNLTNGQLLDIRGEIYGVLEDSNISLVDMLSKVQKIIEEKFTSTNTGSREIAFTLSEIFSTAQVFFSGLALELFKKEMNRVAQLRAGARDVVENRRTA